ncbi:leucyl/phenylalanyl-tRNA--protein transferase [Limnobacter parvus]|uniref:Leucyl/phenylalanyl-tRNA--protein transferase n=1 Tax=Limnobacter parvus TaxID=2939690 RepID=A0ABT1XIC2_9BURK|nr:leucyl/phenylalanyl-tRNA--protein transferase [Limnobacter parvus]MCR2747035.1 leucyl/phenylalanyl-tRNA--protein transferase [Limnobacter parvus]
MSKTTIPWLDSPKDFPDTSEALEYPSGLLAASQEINADWLQSSYAKGIFPWYSQGEPVLWWSTSPRAVLYTTEFKLRRSLLKAVRKMRNNRDNRIQINTAFEAVMRACAAPRQGQEGTWITEEVIAAYVELHRRGFAHSVEHWQGDQLVGGLYCVALGKMIYGESMFSTQTDASKVAFAHFVYWLKSQNVHIIDCQQATGHLMSMGARTVNRKVFETEMANSIVQPTLNWEPRELIWTYDQT